MYLSMLPNGSIMNKLCHRLVVLSMKGLINMYLKRVEDLRIDHDLTQQEVADILHCQREVYRRYEKGIREIPLSYAIILAQYYNVSLDYLVGLSDIK